MSRILKDELNFQGLWVIVFGLAKLMPVFLSVINTQWECFTQCQSDFGATHSTAPSAMAGMDMELPSAEFCESFVSPLVMLC